MLTPSQQDGGENRREKKLLDGDKDGRFPKLPGLEDGGDKEEISPWPHGFEDGEGTVRVSHLGQHQSTPRSPGPNFIPLGSSSRPKGKSSSTVWGAEREFPVDWGDINHGGNNGKSRYEIPLIKN